MKYLTWDDLADFYKKKTGGRARILPQDYVYDWAVKQKEIKETKKGLTFVANKTTPRTVSEPIGPSIFSDEFNKFRKELDDKEKK